MLPLAKGFLGAMALPSLVRFTRIMAQGGPGLDKRLDREKKPYIFVGPVCVRQAYQGQGYMRRVMEMAFAEGDRLGIPVILETDARSKCDKYLHLGMKLAVRAGSVRTVCSTTSSDTQKQNKNRFPPAPALHDAGQAGFFCVFPAIGGSCMLRHV